MRELRQANYGGIYQTSFYPEFEKRILVYDTKGNNVSSDYVSSLDKGKDKKGNSMSYVSLNKPVPLNYKVFIETYKNGTLSNTDKFIVK